jgi:hypothetical protein
MDVKPKVTAFSIFPFFIFTKYENLLSRQAKIDFDQNWKNYVTLIVGWLFWDIEFKLFTYGN